MVLTFSNDMCARVWLVTQWAFVRVAVSISLGQFAVVYLSVYGLEEEDALHRIIAKSGVDRLSNASCARSLDLSKEDESHI
jgi:hypothetical protein